MDEQSTGGAAGIQSTGLVSGLMDFSFTKFITIKFISIIYIILLVLIALGWLFMVVSGFVSGGFMGGVLALVVGTVLTLLYVIMTRIWLEIIVVLFRIGENTSVMAEKARM